MTTSYKRIAITGPECAGKTTLADQLHRQLGGTLISEYARRYLARNGSSYVQEDLDAIALGQMRQWIPAHSHPIICDSDMTTLLIWSEEKYGSTSDLIKTLYDVQQFDVYLLCRPDLPWVEDPFRENRFDRNRLFERYVNTLNEAARPYHIIEGEDRLKSALEFLQVT